MGGIKSTNVALMDGFSLLDSMEDIAFVTTGIVTPRWLNP